MALFMSDQPNLEYVKMKMIPWEVFAHQKLISVTNGLNFEKKIREAYLYKKNLWNYYHTVNYGRDKTILYYPGFYSSLRYQN